MKQVSRQKSDCEVDLRQEHSQAISAADHTTCINEKDRKIESVNMIRKKNLKKRDNFFCSLQYSVSFLYVILN